MPGRSFTSAVRSEFASAEFRHDHIGQQKIDASLVGSHTLASPSRPLQASWTTYPLVSRIMRASLRTASSSSTSKMTSEPLGASQGLRPERVFVRRLGDCRQEMVKVVPPAGLRLATDDTAALLDNSQYRGEAQAGSFAGLFRREERLEDMRLHVLRRCRRRCRARPGSRSAPARAPGSGASPLPSESH